MTDPDLAVWRQQVDFFGQQKPMLFNDPRYKDKAIAIRDGKIVDVDIDDFRLVKRVSETWVNDVVLVVKVSSGLPMVDVDTPEVAP